MQGSKLLVFQRLLHPPWSAGFREAPGPCIPDRGWTCVCLEKLPGQQRAVVGGWGLQIHAMRNHSVSGVWPSWGLKGSFLEERA